MNVRDKNMMGVKLNSRIQALSDRYKKGGAVHVVKGGWRYLLLKSPVASMLRGVLGHSLHEKLVMFPRVGYWPQVESPRSFNEKIMYRKVYTRKGVFGELADKVKVRKYVRRQVGGHVLNDVFHVVESPEDIPFNNLPDEFVVKAGNKGVMIIDNKNDIDVSSIKEECSKRINDTYGVCKGEYWYGDSCPKIMIEKRIHDDRWGVPLDYKLFVFHGRVEYIEVDFNRFSGHKRTMYDRGWNQARFEYEYPRGPEIDPPNRLEDMIDVAEQLGSGFDFVRVDMYHPNENDIIFGEMTFAPENGGGRFYPKRYDFELGKLW